MAPRSFRSFLDRVWLFLALVGTFLLMLQGLHVLAQVRSHGRLVAESVQRAEATARLVLESADPARVAADLREWRARGTLPARPAPARALLARLGVRSVELLTAEGWGFRPQGAPAAEGRPPRLGERDRRRLAGGETVVDVKSGLQGSDYASVIAFHPILDSSGRLLGVLAVDVGAERLATSRRELRWNVALQGGSLLAFLGLVLLFTRWTLRPLHLLARTAGAPEQDTAELALRDDTGFVIDTYRRMIDELQEKEQELRRLREVERHRADELQELNASIVESMVSGALVLDLSGRIRSMNEPCRLALAVGPGRVTGRAFADVLPHVPELHGRLQSCLDEGMVIRGDELRLSLPGIGRRDVELTLSPLRDSDGARTGALCLLVDVTEVKALQERLRLQASLAELGELSAGIAHEFRNSLGSILGFAKLAERHAQGEAAEHAHAIVDEATALGRVVDDFLRFANPTRLVIEPLDLAALFQELGADVAARAGAKAVSYEVAAGLPVVSGDETLLRRVFTNLLRNAADAVRPGGAIRVIAETGSRTITLHVDDDGPGIPPSEREKVFAPFFTRKEGGTGLGLALVRKVVVHHGGRVTVDSSPLGGARFSVTLPMRPERTDR